MDIDHLTARRLIRSLQRGTVISGGAKYIHCGHEKWVEAQLDELTEIEEDHGAVVHFVKGEYGEGKTHFLNYIGERALERGWALAHLQCRKDKVELDKFETIYPNIIQKLILSLPNLTADENNNEDPARKLLDLWCDMVLKESGHVHQHVGQPFVVENKLYALLQERVMKRNLPGDFQRVVCAYPRAVLQQDDSAIADLISWLKGEDRVISIPHMLLAKPGQRVNAPGVSQKLVNPCTIRPITTATSLDVFRGLLWLLRQCGFKGLILSLDEVEQISDLRPRVRVDRALQTLREFVDNTDSEIGLQNVAIYFAATPPMFDNKEYFRSYDALATRIEPIGQEINWRAPVVDLEKTKLTVKQLHWVAARIRLIYSKAFGEASIKHLTDKLLNDIVSTVDKARYRIAKPRLLCRVVVDQLEKLKQGATAIDTEKLVSETAVTLINEK